jgi:uncharacterized RDD family membrane protein YckC
MSSPHPSIASSPVGFAPRLLAAVIDAVIWAILTLALLGDPATLPPGSRFIVDWVLPAAMTLVVWTVWQATPGKMMIRARIVDAETGGLPTLGQYVIRYVGYFLALLPLGLGLLWIMFDSRKRGLHDIMAGTMVVRTPRHGVEARVEHAAHIHAPPAAAPARTSTVPAPRIFPGGFGPWGTPTAEQDRASMVWIRDDVLYLAAVNRENHPGAMAAVSAGAGFPGREVPLGALHSVTAPQDSAEAEITYAVEDGTCETRIASLRSTGERDELLGALLIRMGGGWARVEEQEARAPLLWEGLKAAAAILVVTAIILAIVSTGDLDALQHADGKPGLVLALLALLGMLAGAEWVIIIGGGLVALCALYMVAVAAAPPKRVALRRVAGGITETERRLAYR